MSKHLQLQVPDSCHENWDKMTRMEKGRFCGSCQKKVIDFTNMSDRELVAFFKKPLESVCGRFRQDQLDHDIDIPKKRIPWVKYFFQFTLPVFLMSVKATSQASRTQGKVFATCKKEIMGDTVRIGTAKVEEPVSNEIREIRGRIIETEGNGISYASINLKGTNEVVASDSSGDFILKMRKDIIGQTLVASCVGYTSKEVNLAGVEGINGEDTLQIKMDEYVVTAGLVYVERTPKHIPLLTKIFKDTVFKNFKVYPNPVQAGSILHFQFKSPVPGIYLVHFLNQTGQLIQSEEIKMDEKNRIQSIKVPSVIAGTYFIRMRNKKTGKEYPEKIIIQ